MAPLESELEQCEQRGAMLSYTYLHAGAVWFVLLLFLVVRPVSVWLGLLGAPVSRDQRIMISERRGVRQVSRFSVSQPDDRRRHAAVVGVVALGELIASEKNNGRGGRPAGSPRTSLAP